VAAGRIGPAFKAAKKKMLLPREILALHVLFIFVAIKTSA
jgi:hypothetical protein